MKGLFLAASQFPKNRETRAPLITEIKNFVDQMPEKYSSFKSAPDTDPEGDSPVIRYNKKSNNHYLSSEKGSKKKKWYYVHEDSIWKEKLRD